MKLLYLHFYTLLPVQQKNLLRHVNLEPRVFSFYLDLETKRYFLIWCIMRLQRQQHKAKMSGMLQALSRLLLKGG